MPILNSQKLLEVYEMLTEDQKREASDHIIHLLEIHGIRNPEKSGKELTHRAIGRLIFEYDLDNSAEKPLHNIYAELWDIDRLNPDDFLGSGETDKNGYFEIWYDPHDAGWMDIPDLELRVFEKFFTYDTNGNIETHYKRVFTIEGQDDVTEQTFDFGVQRVPFWEYDPSESIPRILVIDHGEPPQQYAPGRTTTMIKAIAPLEVVKRKHLALNDFYTNRPTIDEIQRDYPDNLTLQIEKERPGFTRSDEYFGDRILNGMSASIIDKDRNNPGWYRLFHHWNAYEQNGIYCLPNVDMRFEIRDEKLFPVQITLQMRQKGTTEPHAPMEAPITFTPNDGDDWLAAKRVARVSAALSAELDIHLAQTHLNVEQYAIPAYRNLRKNPIQYLLFPHLKEVVLIDKSANTLLLGDEGYLARASALTGNSIKLRIQEVMGTLDWKNWQPRKPIIQNHRYAHAANLFWDILTTYVDDFFEQNIDKIVEYWYEVRRFSDELVLHSVPFKPTTMGNMDWYWHEVDKHGHDPTFESHPDIDWKDWFDPNERMDLNIPRAIVNDVPKAIQPITRTDTPDIEDIENLKQVCRYLIFLPTFMHTWANSRQYDDGGEIRYNSLGLRWGENGVIVPESDDSIAPAPREATELLWISCFLSKTGYGYIMKNEDHDIHPRFIEMLREHQATFDEIGLDIYSIQSRSNI